MKNNNEKKSTLKSFFKSKKNIAILILSFLLICISVAYTDSDANKYQTQINNLNNEIKNLKSNTEILTSENNQLKTTITNLENNNKQLTQEKETLENTTQQLTEEKTQLETEKNSLNTQLEELKLSKATFSSNSSKSTNTNVSTTPTYSPSSSSSNSSNTKYTNPSNSEMVWVGETGTKYHYQSCRTLKGKGHQITLKQALQEGRQPCKVCH